MDGLIKYDPSLGKGQSARSKKKHQNTKLFRAVPFVSVKDVTDIVAAIQNHNNDEISSRVTLDMVPHAKPNTKIMPSFKRINSCGNCETETTSEHDESNPAPSLAAANEINIGAFHVNRFYFLQM